jgi:flagellar assembly protein FliH
MARSASSRKFLFDRSFDDPAKLYLPGERNRAEHEAAAAADAAVIADREHKAAQQALADSTREEIEPPIPTEEKKEFTQAHLDAAREEGHIAGHTAALEEAETAREHYIADAVNLIAQGLDELQARQDDANKHTADLAMRMVFGVVQRLLPDYTHHYAVDNMETFVRRVLPLAIGEPNLTVRAHAMIAPDLEVRLKDVFTRAAFQGTYAVIPDYELQPGDCKLEWDGGGADRDEGRIWADVREIIAANVGEANADDLDVAADTAAQGDVQDAPQEIEPEQTTTDAVDDAPEELRLNEEEPVDLNPSEEDSDEPMA